jgi:hypothetical protein
MAVVHEVIGRDGSVRYRGADVSRAIEAFGSAGRGARLRCRRGERAATDVPVPLVLSELDEPVGYALTEAGYAATDDRVFVVDTADVAELRRRCPALFAPRPGGGAA